MFTKGFYKIAGTLKANISPEEYYDLQAEKDPYVGAVLGSLAGAGVGGAKRRTAKAALMGAGLGGAAGASVGHLTGKVGKAVRLALLKKEVHNLKLKSSPGRGDYDQSGGQ